MQEIAVTAISKCFTGKDLKGNTDHRPYVQKHRRSSPPASFEHVLALSLNYHL